MSTIIRNEIDDFFNQGISLYTKGHYDEAVKSFDQVLAIDNDNCYAWMCRGEALDELGQFDEAVTSY